MWNDSLQECVVFSDALNVEVSLSPNNKVTVQPLCSVELRLALIVMGMVIIELQDPFLPHVRKKFGKSRVVVHLAQQDT